MTPAKHPARRDSSHLPLVSLIIPVFNTAAYLPQCLDSVLGQSFSDFEVIAVNDGSTDNSLRILEQYTAKESRIRLISKPNEGQGPSRNLGFKQARGRFVIFVDSDDCLHPEALRILTDIAVKESADAVYCGFKTFQNNFPPTAAPIPQVDYHRVSLRQALVTFEAMPPLYCFTAHALKEANLNFPAIFFEDEAETYRLLLFCKTIIRTPVVLYYYRKHQHSTTGLRMNKRSLDIIKVLHRLLEIAQQHPEHALEFEYKAYTIMSACVNAWGGINEPWAREALADAATIKASLDPRIVDNPYFSVWKKVRDEFEHSWSWKLTRPLRAIHKQLKTIPY